MIKVAAFWKKVDKNGDQYLSGKVDRQFSGGLGNEEGLFLFKNKDKKNENYPDWLLYLADDKPKEPEDRSAQEEDDIPW